MSSWYSLVPAGGVALGNLTPVGQNSGRVGCRFPPNGHHLAACLKLPNNCQLWGAFWHNTSRSNEIYLVLPQTVYCLEKDLVSTDPMPKKIYRCYWREDRWQIQEQHQGCEVAFIGGQYLIRGTHFRSFWQNGWMRNADLVPIAKVWQSLILTHNRREAYQVLDEGGFFAEMVTLIEPGWSILVKIFGDYSPPEYSCLGAGATPVTINPLEKIREDWLDSTPENPEGAVLLTGALWQAKADKEDKEDKGLPVSIPYPIFNHSNQVFAYAYAAEPAIPWQSWKKIKYGRNREPSTYTLTPGEWLTPAGAVYLWRKELDSPMTRSGTLQDDSSIDKSRKRFNNWALGYGHLWLF